ncbi:MAG: hypothetical protein Q9224_001040 [Gallowayella concinna]
MGHATATFNGKTIAETDTYEFVEGNVYVRASLPCPQKHLISLNFAKLRKHDGN